MPTDVASADVFGRSLMPPFSQIVESKASPSFHTLGKAIFHGLRQNARMDDSKNGGPNFLRAWREHNRITLQELADRVGTTASVIGYLESGERGLSAKWLRKLAPALGTTPGRLLDHDPDDVSGEIAGIVTSASPVQRGQILDISRTIVRTGTGD